VAQELHKPLPRLTGQLPQRLFRRVFHRPSFIPCWSDLLFAASIHDEERGTLG
jgi:hypothetical protein